MINPTFNHYPEIAEFAKRAFPEYHMNYFATGRMYRDGHFHHIASSSEWAIDHIFKNKFAPAGLLNFDEIESKQLMFKSKNYDHSLGWTEGAFLAAKEKFNIKNILTIMVKKDDYIDQYMIDIHHENAVDIYLNHMGYIENFFKVIKHQFRDLIETCAKSPFKFDNKLLVKHVIQKNNDILAGNYFLLYHNNELKKLSGREYGCLERLAKGLRPKDIAKECFISYRTVEAHLNNIKLKLGISSTKDLITCYWANKEFANL